LTRHQESHAISPFSLTVELVSSEYPDLITYCRYQERLKVLNLTTFEIRATRVDILQVYKIMMAIEQVKKEDFFERDEGRGRGHSMKSFKKMVRLDIAK